MFGLLSRPTAPPAVRRTLRLEALDGRVLPGGMSGGVLIAGGPPISGASQVSVMHIGEEIPQTGSNHAATQAGHPGQVDAFGGMSGGVL